MHTKTWKRGISLLLCMAMLLGHLPGVSCAMENGTLCEHHTEHTDCGYAEGESACGYVCQLCLQTPEETTEPENTTALAETTEPEQVCTGLADCAAENHEDGCEKKLAGEKTAADREAADSVAAMIDALPSLEEIQAKSLEEQGADYNQVQAAYDAYAQLTEDQRALLPEAKAVFGAYFDYFNGLTAPTTTSGTCGEDLTWILSDGVLTISGTGKMADYADDNSGGYTTPWYEFESEIKKIIIEDGVTSLGDYAFCSTVVEEISLPNSVTSIGDFTFSLCLHLAEIEIPDSVISIGHYAFATCGLTTVSIPAGVTTWGESIFEGCSELSTANISEGITELPNYAFRHSGLTNITIPSSVASIGDLAFYDCLYLVTITFVGDAPAIGDACFQYTNPIIAYYPANNATWTENVMQDYGGEITWICASCKDGHTEVIDEAVESTCTTDGLTEGSHCSVCDEIIAAQEVIPAGHTVENGICTFCGAYGTCGENLTWEFDESAGKLTVSGTGAMYDYAKDDNGVNSPWAECAFTEVDLEEGVTSIGDYAFSGIETLTDVYLPETLKTIGNHTFANCTELNYVEFGSEITQIGVYAFAGCTSLFDAWVPEKVTVVNEGLFSGCTHVDYITLPDGLLEIGDYAFEGCEEGYLTIPTKVTRLGTRAFADNGYLGEVTIPAGVTALGAQVFRNCAELDTIKFQGDAPVFEQLDDGQTQDQFAGVTATVYYPTDNDTWTEAVMQQYGGEITWVAYDTVVTGTCGTGLTWTYDEVSRILTISGSGTMDNYADVNDSGDFNMPWADYLSDVEKIVVEEGVTSVGNNAFFGSNATEVELPEGLISIGDYAFGLSTELTEITIPASVTSIGSSAFYGCIFSEIVLPDGLTYLGDNAFSGCENLTAIEIPASLTEISGWTFTHAGLTSITIPGTVRSIGESAFQHCHLESVTIEEGVTSIGDWAFYWTDIAEVTLPETITSVGMGAFCDTRLTSIRIPASVTSIGPGAFDCDSLLNIEVDDTSSSYMNDADGVLYNKDQTTLVACPGGYQGAYSIPSTVTRIEDRAFIGCSGLTQITIPEGVTYIGEMAFATCKGLTEVVIPEGVTTLGEAAFDGCSALADITIPESVTALPGHVFGNTALTNYRIPDSITSIGEYAFSMCDVLTEITIPDSVTYMGDCTFYRCGNLEKVVFEGSAPEFGKGSNSSRGMFSGVTATVYYPADDATWTEDVKQDYDGTITWVAVEAVENRVMVTSADLNNQTSVWIDGVEYAVQTDGGAAYIDLPDGNAETMVAYTYHAEDSSDVHTQYPTGMQVWTLTNEDGLYTATRVEELDNILQYAGSSIRATGKQGIRMITAIGKAKKNALISGGLAGYTLKEYGTVVAWASQLDADNPLVLGASYAKSNYAYKKGIADPVLAYDGDMMQYTNVLVGFSLDKCKDDVAMRPYMILADAAGNEITLYGGTVERSIGYIAYQNRNTFAPDTEAYAYIWEIIHAVYGDAYDAEYQGA